MSYFSPMRVVYMAHPVRGSEGVTLEDNLAATLKRAKWIEANYPDVAVVASWYVECLIWDDSDDIQRAAGMRRNKAVIARCDELWAVGDRISRGMAEEIEFARLCGVRVEDYTGVRYVTI